MHQWPERPNEPCPVFGRYRTGLDLGHLSSNCCTSTTNGLATLHRGIGFASETQ